MRLLDAVRAGDVAAAQALLEAGADVRHGAVLHAAARRGPLALVELLLRHGALEWQPDGEGRTALDAAHAGNAPERDAIVELLDRPVIRDPEFRAAVAASHAGDVAALERLLDASPRLLRERIVEPACYRESGRPQYFLDPKLVWFVANNPTLIAPMPARIVDVTRALIVRGVEPGDLAYTLELVMTSASAREHGHQLGLIAVLLEAGAVATAPAIVMALAHGELQAVEALLAAGYPITPPIAAALGRLEPAQLAAADVQIVLGLAVINGRVEAARAALEAGADPNAFLPVHAHSTALHQATLSDDVELLELLVSFGARTDIEDKLWSSTPLGWAIREKRPRARAYLEALA